MFGTRRPKRRFGCGDASVRDCRFGILCFDDAAEGALSQKVVTCLGFNRHAENTVNFYTSIVRNSDSVKSEAVTKAMLQMTKLDMATLEAAAGVR